MSHTVHGLRFSVLGPYRLSDYCCYSAGYLGSSAWFTSRIGLKGVELQFGTLVLLFDTCYNSLFLLLCMCAYAYMYAVA